MADEDQSLAEAAENALDEPEEQQLPGVDTSRVKFLGMAWDALEIPPLKEEVEFVVRGTVVEHGEKVMKDGDVRDIAKVDVTAVRRVKTGTLDRLKEESETVVD